MVELQSMLIVSIAAGRHVGGYPFSIMPGIEYGFALFSRKSVYLHNILDWMTFTLRIPKWCTGSVTVQNFLFGLQKVAGSPTLKTKHS